MIFTLYFCFDQIYIQSMLYNHSYWRNVSVKLYEQQQQQQQQYQQAKLL